MEQLTPREREVLAMVAQGRSNQGICSRLHLSQKTVESHLRSIFGKLHISPTEDDHRRVLSVLMFLDSDGLGDPGFPGRYRRRAE